MDHAADTYRTDLMTITRYVLNEQSKHPESRGDLTILLSHIVLGCKFVASAVNKAGLAKLTGLAGETNVQASVLSVFFSHFEFSSAREWKYDDDDGFPWLWGLLRGRSRRSWTSCPTRSSSMPSSAAAAPYESSLVPFFLGCLISFSFVTLVQCVLVSEEDELATFVDPKLRGKYVQPRLLCTLCSHTQLPYMRDLPINSLCFC
jgi:fructose-1,6-bisphosphatase I